MHTRLNSALFILLTRFGSDWHKLREQVPIDLLVYMSEVCPERSLLDIFPGGPLHYLLGANTILDWLNKMLPGFVSHAIEAPVADGG